MEQVGEYVLSISAAALICGIVLGFLNSGINKDLIKLICGLFLAASILRPILDLELKDLTSVMDSYTEDAEAFSAQGKEMSLQAMAAIIKSQSEAYILDKAGSLDLDIQVDVTVSQDDPPLPIGVSVSGTIPPYKRSLLSSFLEAELGIAKECQQWTG